MKIIMLIIIIKKFINKFKVFYIKKDFEIFEILFVIKIINNLNLIE